MVPTQLTLRAALEQAGQYHTFLALLQQAQLLALLERTDAPATGDATTHPTAHTTATAHTDADPDAHAHAPDVAAGQTTPDSIAWIGLRVQATRQSGFAGMLPNAFHLALTRTAVSQQQAAQRPNIIFFLVDDMGWEDTSVPFWDSVTAQNKKFRTPNMEMFAATAEKFTSAYANSICTPSRVSLMTGMNAARHRVTNWTMFKDKAVDATDSVLALPGHGLPFRNLAGRARQISQHHRRRLQRLNDALGEPTTLVGSLPAMFSRPLDGIFLTIGLTEARSHLHYLTTHGAIEVWALAVAFVHWLAPALGWTLWVEPISHAAAIGIGAATSYVGHRLLTFRAAP